MTIKKKCVQTLSTSKIKCAEDRRKIIFNNRAHHKVDRIIVDNCQITDGIRCDFLVKHNKNEYFVELKGEDIKHAFEQLKRSILILGSDDCIKRYSYVISSRSPLASAQIQNIRLLFMKKHKSMLVVKNNSFEVNL